MAIICCNYEKIMWAKTELTPNVDPLVGEARAARMAVEEASQRK